MSAGVVRGRVLKDNEGIPAVVLAVLSVLAGISVANIYYCQPLLAVIARDLGVSETSASMIAMITQAGYAGGLFFIVPAGDMVSRKKIVTVSFLILSVALYVMSLADSMPFVLVTGFIIGACSVMPQIFIPIAAQYALPDKKGQSVGMIVSGLLTGILSSRVISGIVGDWFGWRSMYIIAAAVMLVSSLIVMRIMPRTSVNYTGNYMGLIRSIAGIVRKYRALRICSVRSAFAFGSFLAMWGSLTFRIEQPPFSAGSDVVGLLGLCGVAGAIMASVVGRYVQKVGVRKFNVAGCLLILLAWFLLWIPESNYVFVVLAIILMDIGMQCIQLSNQTSVFALDAKASGRINTVFMTCFFLGGSLGTLLSGLAWGAAGWNGVVLTGAVLALCSLSMAGKKV